MLSAQAELITFNLVADPEVDLFAGMKKKKKKQVAQELGDAVPAEEQKQDAPASVSVSAPAEEATEATSSPVVAAPDKPDEEVPVSVPEDQAAPALAGGEDGGDFFADLKKKKKKKKEIPLDLESGAADTSAPATSDAAAAAAPATLDGLDVPMKKKKSKKPASDFAKELDELDAENDDGVEGGELGDDPFAETSAGPGSGAASNGVGAWVKEGREATYPELLSRFFTLLHAHNPELAGEKRKYSIVPPVVQREGTKKTAFTNLTDICRRMHRQPEHVIQFLYAELGTTGSLDGAQRLVMKGRFNQKQIENVLRKYIVEYVTCKICKSPDTLLGKENRLYFMTCEACGSRLSVSAIKAGYQAQGKRIKAA